MTEAEAKTLKVGDTVYARYGFDNGRCSRLVYINDIDIHVHHGYLIFSVARVGFDKLGRSFPYVRRTSGELSKSPEEKIISPRDAENRATANIFADWLEEVGEQRAADLLRKTFPIA